MKFLLAALLFPMALFAQNNGKISGIVLAEYDSEPLEGATISVLLEESGKFVTHTVSNAKGEFLLKGLPLQKSLELIVSFTGYADTSAIFQLESSKILSSGEWKMKIGGEELSAVTVVRRKPPFIVKKDTLEFDVSSIESLPSDMVQDLLRKLPGMVIDENGNVTVNGQKVNKIRVDGRDFFGNNIKMAMENLPGAIIEKVQVMETREPLEARNSIIQPVQKDITINLVLKKESRGGVFGNISAGGGTRDRYLANGILNSFNEGKNFSLYGNLGNVEGMSMGRNGEGQRALIGNLQGGIIQRKSSLGVNMNNQISAKIKLDINYNYDNAVDQMTAVLERTNILPDSTFLYNSIENTSNNNSQHAIQANMLIDIDTLQQLSISPEIQLGKSKTQLMANAFSSATNEKLINAQDNNNINNNQLLSFSNRMSYRRMSKNHRSVLNTEWTLGVNNYDERQFNNAENIFYQPNDTVRQLLDQRGFRDGNQINSAFNIQLNHNIGKNFTTIMRYELNIRHDRAVKDLFDYNSNTGQHDLPDTAFSNSNKNLSVSHWPSASIGYKYRKFMAEAGVGVRWLQQDNRLLKYDSVVSIGQRNFSPRITLGYDFSPQSRLTFDYTVQSTPPSQDQLAPLPDNSNPLYIRTGNPALATAITHQLNSGVQYFSRDYKWRVIGNASANFVFNAIIQENAYDSIGRLVTSFRNIDGQRQNAIRINVGKNWKINDWTMDIGLDGGFSNSRTIGWINNEENITTTGQISSGLHTVFSYKTLFTLFLHAGAELNNTNYSLPLEGLRYNSKRLIAFTRVSPFKRMHINSSVFHIYNSQIPENLQRSRTIWNCSIGYELLKQQQLAVSLGINDILNNNVISNQYVTANAIELKQVNSLKRYAMLTVSYRLSNFRR